MSVRGAVSSVTGEVGRRLLASLPVRCLRRWGLIDGRSRSFAIAGQAFTTLVPLLSLTRSLQRAYEAAWALPSRGLFGTVNGLTGVSLLIAQLIVLTLLTSAIRPLPAGAVLTEAVRLVVSVPVWLLLQHLLLSRRIPMRRLLPGAAIAAVGQVVLSVYSALWMPHIVGGNAERYGLIGVTFALVSWLIVVGIAVVGGAVLAAELAGRPQPVPR
jgi:membrane protein